MSTQMPANLVGGDKERATGIPVAFLPEFGGRGRATVEFCRPVDLIFVDLPRVAL
jgi:hypothetical protein